ncbi:hypothetical protein ABIA10_006610 [Rhizobium leguminosarum]
MAVTFMDLAQDCAPMVEVRTLAAVISLESGFKPFAFRHSHQQRPAARASTRIKG